MFELLWRLVCHDIFFLWERIEYLSSTEDETVAKVPFTWVPVAPKDNFKNNPMISQMSGFASIPMFQDFFNSAAMGNDAAGEDVTHPHRRSN